MKNTNEILEAMPQYGMYNEGGFIPTYVHFELSKAEVQDIVLEFARGFVPDVLAISWIYDKEKDKSDQDGCTRMFMIFKEDAKSVTGKYGEDTVLCGNDNYRSKDLVAFLKKYAVKTSGKDDGYVGATEMDKTGGSASAMRVGRTIGFELDPRPIFETIFDARGYAYASAIGVDKSKANEFRTNIVWGEVTTDGRVSGMYIRKLITSATKHEENFNGKFAPRKHRSF